LSVLLLKGAAAERCANVHFVGHQGGRLPAKTALLPKDKIIFLVSQVTISDWRALSLKKLNFLLFNQEVTPSNVQFTHEVCKILSTSCCHVIVK
jgi:hypothetical protein